MHKVTICGIDTSTLPKLTAKESDELLSRIAEGDGEAKERFLRANMRLVLSVVGRFSASQESADDLFQAGMVGMLKALNNFDRTLGMRFSTYAVPMIIGEIRRTLRDRTGVKVPRSLRDLAYKALKAREKLTERSLRDPCLTEIAEEMHVDPSDVACALDAVSEPVSFFDPAFSDEDALSQSSKPHRGHKGECGCVVGAHCAVRGVETGPERELSVLKMRYFDGKTQNEISERVGVSQAQVSRLEKSAVARLKKLMM